MSIMEANYFDQVTQTNKRRVACATAAAIGQGYGLVYDLDYGTAATADERRQKIVISPTAANASDFAGVLIQAKAAHTDTFEWVNIACPGDTAYAYVGEAVTIGDLVKLDVGTNVGKFMKESGNVSRGLGCAIALQTITTAGLCLVWLLEGEDRGLLQNLAPAAAGGAIVLSKYGETIIDGTSVSTADCTATLANGTEIGQRKYIRIGVAIGNSKNFVLTVTSGVQIDDTTALATITFNAKDELALLEWRGDAWRLLHYSGATLA
jgi:hypothetical protein